MPTINELEQELIGKVREAYEGFDTVYSIYTIEDLLRQSEFQSYPFAAVGWNNTLPYVPEGSTRVGNQVIPVANGAAAVQLVDLQFLVVVGIQYGFAGQEDTKKSATDLLGLTRAAIMGFKGVNSRPWRLLGERPEPEAAAEGVAMFSQVWHTAVPVVGNSTE